MLRTVSINLMIGLVLTLAGCSMQPAASVPTTIEIDATEARQIIAAAAVKAKLVIQADTSKAVLLIDVDAEKARAMISTAAVEAKEVIATDAANARDEIVMEEARAYTLAALAFAGLARDHEAAAAARDHAAAALAKMQAVRDEANKPKPPVVPPPAPPKLAPTLIWVDCEPWRALLPEYSHTWVASYDGDATPRVIVPTPTGRVYWLASDLGQIRVIDFRAAVAGKLAGK